ncbi:MAG: metallophosphoesterase [Haloarculaceae archaeon]
MSVRFRDRAALLGETLVCADLHAGKDRTANVELPLGERENLLGRTRDLLERFEPAEVVFAGDVLHSFDRLPAAARETLSALRQTISEAGSDLVVLGGNHDTMLDTLWPGDVRAEYEIGPLAWPWADGAERSVVACHGHVEPAADADCYVIGHDHPTITIEGRKWHCYLYGESAYRGADVLVLPAFSHLVEGVSINRRFGTSALDSPLISDLGQFRPIVWDEGSDETRSFPPLSEFRRLL